MHKELDFTHPVDIQRTVIASLGYLVVAIIVLFILFHNLGNHSISIKSDEVIYTRVTQGIVHSGDFINLRHGSSPFFHKPPLKFAISAIAPSLFGESNFTYRVADAVLGVLTCIAVALLSYKLFHNHIVAILACILTFSSLELTIEAHSFRKATLDGLLIFLTLCSALLTTGLLSHPHSKTRQYQLVGILGLAIGCCILTKSAGGLVPLFCTVASILVLPSRLIRRERIIFSAAICILSVTLSSVYYIPLLLESEKARSIIIGGEILHRALYGYAGHNTGDPYFYLRYLFQKSGAIPSSFLSLALISGILYLRKSQLQFLAIWGFMPVILYSFASAKTPWYISPATPLISIYAARLITTLPSSTAIFGASLNKILFIAWGLFILLGCVQLFEKYEHIFRTVLNQSARLPLDSYVEETLKSNKTFHVYLLENAIHGGTNPKKGRYNVEGLYRQMLQPNVSKITSLTEVSCTVQICSLITPYPLTVPPPGFSLHRTLPAFGVRKFEAYIYQKITP